MARTILHRLYLSAMALLLVGGVGIAATIYVSHVHDERVTREDRACYERKTKELADERKTKDLAESVTARLPPPPAGYKLDPANGWRSTAVRVEGEFDPDAFLAAANAKECNFSFAYDSEGHSTRTWLGWGDGDFWLAPLALLPALALWLFAVWIRWLFKPASPV